VGIRQQSCAALKIFADEDSVNFDGGAFPKPFFEWHFRSQMPKKQTGDKAPHSKIGPRKSAIECRFAGSPID
jgi:hypothetical protein